MNDKHFERQVDNAWDCMYDNVIMLKQKITELEQDIEDLKKEHDKELIVFYDKGYNDAVLDLPKHLVK